MPRLTLNQLLAARLAEFQREQEAREAIARAATPEDLAFAKKALRQVQAAQRELRQPYTTCGARTRLGAPCAKWPVDGSKRCELHGGKTPRGRQSAKYLHGRRMRRPTLTLEQYSELAEALTRATTSRQREDHERFRQLYAQYFGRPAP